MPKIYHNNDKEQATETETTAKKGSPLMTMKHSEFVEHAKSIGKDAVLFLIQLNTEKIPLTEQQREKRYKTLKAKVKKRTASHVIQKSK